MVLRTPITKVPVTLVRVGLRVLVVTHRTASPLLRVSLHLVPKDTVPQVVSVSVRYSLMNYWHGRAHRLDQFSFGTSFFSLSCRKLSPSPC